MRNRTKLMIVVPVVLLVLGVAYYWHYVRPVVEADKVFREGLRLYEEAKSEDGGEFNSKYQASIHRLSVSLQQPAGRVPAANRVRAVEVLGAIGEKYWEDGGLFWVFLAPGFPVTSPVVEVLGKLCRDQDVAVRRAAVQALARTGVTAAAEPLIAALKDPDTAVRHDAVFALATLYNAQPLLGWAETTIAGPVQYDFRPWLRAAERSIHQGLCATLKDSDPAMRERAAIALGQIGARPNADLSRDAAVLRDARTDDSVAVRIYAYRALERLSWRDESQRESLRAEAVPLLAKALEHEDWTVRYKAADVLREVRTASALAPLVRALLHDEHPPVRLAAAQALHAIGDEAWVQPLIAAVGDPDSGVRYAVAEALSALGQPAVAALQEAARTPDARVRLGAALALGMIQHNLAAPALKQPADRQLLAEMLRSDGEASRQFAAELGGLSGDKALVGELVAALEDSNSNVRYRAAEALGRIGDPAAVEALSKTLRDPCQAVRVRAAEALGAIQAPSAVPALVEAMRDQDRAVRKFAGAALSRIGAPAVPALIAALGSRGAPGPRGAPWRDGPLQGGRGGIIGFRFGGPEKSDHTQREHANEFPIPLGGIGAPAVEPLIGALEQRDPVALHGAILALARLWAKDPDGESHPLTGRRLKFRTSEHCIVPARVSKAFTSGGVWLPTEPTKPLPLILGIEIHYVPDDGRPAKPDPQLAPETTIALVDALTKVLTDPALRSKAGQREDRHLKTLQILRDTVLVLGLVRSPRAVDALMKVLPDGVIGGDAAVALGRIKDPQSVVRLIDDLRHPTTRTWAALALGKIGDPRAIEPLEEALKNTAEGWSRDTVRRALDKLKGKGE